MIAIDINAVNPAWMNETSSPMINGVPVALALVGASLALSRFDRYHFAATALGGLAGLMQVFALFAYLSGIYTFYGSVETPRPLTAVGLLCFVIAIVLRIGAMPVLRKPRPLWQLQVMLGCAILTPLLLFGVYTGIRITDAQLREVRNELMSEARILSVGVDREIIGEIERLQALAASPSLRQGDFAEFQRQAEASLALQQLGNIVLIDRDMKQLVNTFVPFGKPLPKAVVPKPIERTFATGKPQVTGLFMAPVVDQFSFGINVPVEIGGESRYVLGRSQDQHALARLVAANELPPGWLAAIADTAHRIIARSEQEDAFIGKELLPVQWHRAGPGGVFEFIDSEGRPSLQASATSELTGWQTAVWVPKALLEAPVRALWWTIGLTALTAFGLVVALASWLGRTIARSVGHAARAATTLGKGGLLPSDETPVAEVDTLMAELRGAAARRQAAEDWLRESKDCLQIALNVAQLGSYRYDPRRRVFSGDTRSQQIFDFPKNEAEEIMKLVHPDDVAIVQANFKAALDPVDPRHSATEFRLRRKDGEVRWVETLGLAYFEGEGRDRRAVTFVGTLQDITERKEREEKEHLLMREINHRAKNMLSVVDAIAHQTATRNPEDFVERFSERIQALSANQDLLVRNEWNGVEIEDLVRAQLALFADLIGSRIAVHGPKLRLNAASAQAVGLALHELATNAGKYGALSTDTGRVDVCWESDGDTFTMSWTERDGPPVSAPKRRGFGTIVMAAMAERSVDGVVDLDYAPSGLTWRLTCPAASALESWEREQNSSESDNRTEGATTKINARTIA
jgi:two-component sensor histidine kinase